MLANFFNEISTNVHRDKWLKGGYHFYLRFFRKGFILFSGYQGNMKKQRQSKVVQELCRR